MKEKIIARLKALLQTLGVKNLSNTRIDAIAAKLESKITDEAEIDGRLNDLNEVYPFADIAKQDDQIRTFQQKPKPVPVKTDDPLAVTVDPEKPVEGETATDKLLKQLLEKVGKLESRDTAAAHTARLYALLKEKKVDQKYLDDPLRKEYIQGKTFKDEAELEAFVEKISTEYTSHVQTENNNGLRDQPAPIMGVVSDPKTEVSGPMKEFLKDKKAKEEVQKKTA
jgi:hypothetical protein